MTRTLLTNVHVIDCSGAEPFHGEVLIEDTRIAAVADTPGEISAEGAITLDGQGRSLMPGLVESHAHLSIDNTDDLAALGRIPPEEHTLLTMHNARLYLDHGITSCISAAAAKLLREGFPKVCKATVAYCCCCCCSTPTNYVAYECKRYFLENEITLALPPLWFVYKTQG